MKSIRDCMRNPLEYIGNWLKRNAINRNANYLIIQLYELHWNFIEFCWNFIDHHRMLHEQLFELDQTHWEILGQSILIHWNFIEKQIHPLNTHWTHLNLLDIVWNPLNTSWTSKGPTWTNHWHPLEFHWNLKETIWPLNWS